MMEGTAGQAVSPNLQPIHLGGLPCGHGSLHVLKQSTHEEWHPLFCEALDKKDYIDYLLDELMLCSKDQFEEMRSSCGKEVDKIGERLERYVRENGGKDRRGPRVHGANSER